MLKCWAQLKEESIEKFNFYVTEGIKENGSASWLVLRTYAELEAIEKNITACDIGFDARAVMARLTTCEQTLVYNMLRCTIPAKREGWKAAHKTNCQRSSRFCEWMKIHEQDLHDLEILQKKCNRKAPPNMDERKTDLESLLN